MPLVSTSTRGQRSSASPSSAASPGCSSGSPPVTTSRGASPSARASFQISEAAIARPPPASHEYLVSHQWHPTPHPCSRTKCAGVPADGPSPWRDRKISLMR